MKAVAIILWIVVGAAFAGMGLTIVLALPQLADHSMKYIPWASLAGFVLAMPISWVMAKKLSGRMPGV
jgi:flagellar biosynthesis protein FliQ